MTPNGIREYVEAIKGRYVLGGKAEKGRLLTEFCLTTGLHRKSAIRLLRSRSPKDSGRRGRKREYGSEVAAALRAVWEMSDWMCSKRLQPYLGEFVGVLERHGELELASEVREKLVRLSASTVDRLLKPHRDRNLRRPYLSGRRSVSTLRSEVPIRTGVEYGSVGVGHLEVDLVAHCGESTEGSYVHTLDAVDFATGWCELVPIWGKTQDHVGSAIAALQRRLPFELQGLDCDNGTEFINQVLYRFCHRQQIEFTRSRPYRKNDQAHVEQRNWFVVRRMIGYDRYSTKAAFTQLEATLRLLQDYMNYFQPIRKLQSKETNGRIGFEHVSLSYQQDDRLALRDICLEIPAGQAVALVGASGSGKSTLANLVPRFYLPSSGRITLDGHDLADLTLASLRANIALVSQEVVLFNDTIAANIAYGQMREVPEAEIIAAAQAAHAMEFIREMPEGLNTLVGERGVKLSGGQRQRIAIARAILKNAPILILDEATSALDSESERQVQAALETLMQGRTSLVIAHRLSTIEKADRIVVLQKGEIVETGTHRELLAKNGVYAQLHRIQFANAIRSNLDCC